jgi:hypothetical protein
VRMPCPRPMGAHAPSGAPSPPPCGPNVAVGFVGAANRQWRFRADQWQPSDFSHQLWTIGSRAAGPPYIQDHHYINPPSQMGTSFVQCVSRRSPAKFLPKRRQGGTVLGGMTSASWFLKFHFFLAAVRIILPLGWGALPILHGSVVVVLL